MAEAARLQPKSSRVVIALLRGFWSKPCRVMSCGLCRVPCTSICYVLPCMGSLPAWHQSAARSTCSIVPVDSSATSCAPASCAGLSPCFDACAQRQDGLQAQVPWWVSLISISHQLALLLLFFLSRLGDPSHVGFSIGMLEPSPQKCLCCRARPCSAARRLQPAGAGSPSRRCQDGTSRGGAPAAVRPMSL